MVRLKVRNHDGFYHGNSDFNSNMVRLKVFNKDHATAAHANFNSNMVRLKELLGRTL